MQTETYTQTETQTMNHKYPQPLQLLPEQLVSAERLVEHIEEEQEVSIRDVAYEYMKERFPNGLPKPSEESEESEEPVVNMTGIGEKVVEKLRHHPSLWYNSPNYNCIGEYRVEGYEWMRFINYIRTICYECMIEEDDQEEKERTVEVQETTSSHASQPPPPPRPLPKNVNDTDFNQFVNNSFTAFFNSDEFVALKQSDQNLQLKGKIGKAKGHYFKFINKCGDFSSTLRELNKDQKLELVQRFLERIENEYENIEVSVQKSTTPPLVNKEIEDDRSQEPPPSLMESSTPEFSSPPPLINGLNTEDPPSLMEDSAN